VTIVSLTRHTVNGRYPPCSGKATYHGRVSAKHTALGASSPLGNLKWTEIDPALAAAKTHDDAAGDLSKQAEKEYRDRDVTMPKVTQALRDARDTARPPFQGAPNGEAAFVVTRT
jgi:hypothetical protein